MRACMSGIHVSPVTTTVTIPLILSFTVRYYSIFSKVDSTRDITVSFYVGAGLLRSSIMHALQKFACDCNWL